jgi:transcriptional/translational regulatory protein YebC/TACO1
MFERKGQILIEKEKATEDQLMNLALEAGADDVRDEGDNWQILSAPESHMTVVEAVEKSGLPIGEQSFAWIPKNTVDVEGNNAKGILKLIDALEDHDDVLNVWANFDISEKEMEALA